MTHTPAAAGRSPSAAGSAVLKRRQSLFSPGTSRPSGTKTWTRLPSGKSGPEGRVRATIQPKPPAK